MDEQELVWYGREWPYKNVKPRIICEKYMVDESGTELKTIKYFVLMVLPPNTGGFQ